MGTNLLYSDLGQKQFLQNVPNGYILASVFAELGVSRSLQLSHTFQRLPQHQNTPFSMAQLAVQARDNIWLLSSSL